MRLVAKILLPLFDRWILIPERGSCGHNSKSSANNCILTLWIHLLCPGPFASHWRDWDTPPRPLHSCPQCLVDALDLLSSCYSEVSLVSILDKQESAIVWGLDKPQSFQNIIQQAADLPRPPAYIPCCAVYSSPPAALNRPLSTSKIAHHPQMRPLLSTTPGRSLGCSL